VGEHHTRQCLDLDIAQRSALDLGAFPLRSGVKRIFGPEKRPLIV